MSWQEERCGSCNRLLLKTKQLTGAGDISIKCPRCGAINNLRPAEVLSNERHERAGKEPACGSTPQPRK
ncbi:MAG: Com family DNA-binding transcriptional regulator [Pseudomonadota bacterium]